MQAESLLWAPSCALVGFATQTFNFEDKIKVADIVLHILDFDNKTDFDVSLVIGLRRIIIARARLLFVVNCFYFLLFPHVFVA